MKKKKNNLIDLHCHILPDLDDGAAGLEQALQLAQRAVEDGIGYIVATPHHLDRHYLNSKTKVELAVDQFQIELKRHNIPLTLFASQEVHLNGELLKGIDTILGLDSERKYLLLELPHEMVPDYVEETIFELSCAGITAVIAHPERNAQLLNNPQKLFELENQGALAQVTATSLVGKFGKRVKKAAQEFVTNGLVQIVASDAHALPKREFVLSEAYHVLNDMDPEYRESFQNNARNVINGEAIDNIQKTQPQVKRKFWLL